MYERFEDCIPICEDITSSNIIIRQGRGQKACNLYSTVIKKSKLVPDKDFVHETFYFLSLLT
jgi:hypothetical protein